jgi:hypothetical protein
MRIVLFRPRSFWEATVTRKPTAYVTYKIRLREALRRPIEAAAKKGGHSINRELINRIEDSFGQQTERALDDIASDMNIAWSRFSERFLRLELNEELTRAVDALLSEVDKLAPTAKLDAPAVTKVVEAAAKVRSIRKADEAM